MHTSVAEKFGIKYKPLKLRRKTATGVDEDAIKGIVLYSQTKGVKQKYLLYIYSIGSA